MAELFTLPNVVVVRIARRCHAERDMSALMRTCDRFHGLLIAELYLHNIHHSNASSLLWGAKNAMMVTMQRALQYGADVNTYGPDIPETPQDICEMMVKNGTFDKEAKETNPDRVYGTALHWASRYSKRDAVVSYLLDNGADIKAYSKGVCQCPHEHDKFSMSGFPRPRWQPLHLAMCSRYISRAQILIDHGADLNTACFWPLQIRGISLMHVIGAEGFDAVLQYLEEKQKPIDVHALDDVGNTPLHYIAQSCSNTTCIKRLLALGADLEATNDEGKTPLMECVDMGNYGAAMDFVYAGAKVKLKPQRQHPLIYQVVQPPRFPLTPPHFPSLRAQPNDSSRRLCWGLSQQHFVKKLIQMGANPADVVIQGHGDIDNKVFTAAVDYWNPDTDLLEILLDAGCNVNTQNRDGRTAMHNLIWNRKGLSDSEFTGLTIWDLKEKKKRTIMLLLSHGARLDIKDHNGLSVLGYAAKHAGRASTEFVAELFCTLVGNRRLDSLSQAHLDEVTQSLFDEGHENICRVVVAYGASEPVAN